LLKAKLKNKKSGEEESEAGRPIARDDFFMTSTSYCGSRYTRVASPTGQAS
jgi:hypothetical protein